MRLNNKIHYGHSNQYFSVAEKPPERIPSRNWQMKAQEPVENYGISASRINKLKTENLLHALKKVKFVP